MSDYRLLSIIFFFFFNDTATTEIYTLSLHDALPIYIGSRWLLNIAYMAVGGYPSLVPKQYLIPGLRRQDDASFPHFTDVARSVGADITGQAGGLCIEDFNRDGLLDLFTTSWGFKDPVS